MPPNSERKIFHFIPLPFVFLCPVAAWALEGAQPPLWAAPILILGIAGFGLLALFVAFLTVKFLMGQWKESRAAKKGDAAASEKMEGRTWLGTALGLGSLYAVMAVGFFYVTTVLVVGGMDTSVIQTLVRVVITVGLASFALLFLFVAYHLGGGLWKGLKQAKSSRAAIAQPTFAVDIPPVVTRRSFLSLLGWAWVLFTAASLGATATILRFFFPNVIFEPPLKFKAGYPASYSMGVDERLKESHRVWIVRNEKGFYSLSTICTHLGCTPNWMLGEQKFKCPCHGSGYYITGINFEGPAPRPLPRYHISWADDGQIQVDEGIQYQFELGQWGLPGSFLDYTG